MCSTRAERSCWHSRRGRRTSRHRRPSRRPSRRRPRAMRTCDRYGRSRPPTGRQPSTGRGSSPRCCIPRGPGRRETAANLRPRSPGCRPRAPAARLRRRRGGGASSRSRSFVGPVDRSSPGNTVHEHVGPRLGPARGAGKAMDSGAPATACRAAKSRPRLQPVYDPFRWRSTPDRRAGEHDRLAANAQLRARSERAGREEPPSPAQRKLTVAGPKPGPSGEWASSLRPVVGHASRDSRHRQGGPRPWARRPRPDLVIVSELDSLVQGGLIAQASPVAQTNRIRGRAGLAMGMSYRRRRLCRPIGWSSSVTTTAKRHRAPRW